MSKLKELAQSHPKIKSLLVNCQSNHLSLRSLNGLDLGFKGAENELKSLLVEQEISEAEVEVFLKGLEEVISGHYHKSGLYYLKREEESFKVVWMMY